METGMTRAWLALLLWIGTTSHGFALTVGDARCADTGVVGRVTRQTYKPVPQGFDVRIQDVELHLRLDVLQVLKGPAPTGPLIADGIWRRPLPQRTPITFYFKHLNRGWWIAYCGAR
jgi:hypothetical protein